MNTQQTLIQRCKSKCELCSADSALSIYSVPPVTTVEADNSIMLCEVCETQINHPDAMDVNHWRCLNDAMWSPVSAVQIMAWRLLTRLSTESWAQDLLDMMYLDEEIQQWAESGLNNPDDDVEPTLDSNGTRLQAGDTVTLIKDLVVKGANFTAKRGTSVRSISLTSNPEHIEGRVNGTRIVLLSCFLKKA